jgi:dihydrofolate reductase
MKTIVVAYDKKYGIGAENDLLWLRDLPADLKHFKDTTMGGAIIMGRKTYAAIGRPLPGRQSIVISRDAETIDGVDVVHSMDEAYAKVEPGRRTYVIGGGQIYQLALSTIDTILATEVDAEFPQATVFFPVIDKAVWRETERQHFDADEQNRYAFDFVTYERI